MLSWTSIYLSDRDWYFTVLKYTLTIHSRTDFLAYAALMVFDKTFFVAGSLPCRVTSPQCNGPLLVCSGVTACALSKVCDYAEVYVIFDSSNISTNVL